MRNHEARLQPGTPRKKCRKTFALIGVNKTIGSAFAHAHQIRHRDRSIIERQGKGRAVEITPGNHVIRFCKHKRIIGRRRGFNQQYLFTMSKRAAYRPVHLRHTTQTVCVLHARIVGKM